MKTEKIKRERIQLDLTHGDVEKLDALKQKAEKTTRSAAIRSALETAALLNTFDPESTMHITAPDGTLLYHGPLRFFQ